jgi:uncharacterized SAM-binding protein YcdF (DUF218 family)
METGLEAPACSGEAGRFHVLLAGGVTRAPLDEQDLGALSEGSLLRGMRFVRQFGGPELRPVVVTGGGPGIADSRLMAELMQRAGLPAARLRVEAESLNTWDSARAVRRQFATPAMQIVLSTSALHLRRAALAFRAQGFDVCANALYSDFLPPTSPGYFFPQSSALRKTEAALHELIGLAAYALRARATQELAGRANPAAWPARHGYRFATPAATWPAGTCSAAECTCPV